MLTVELSGKVVVTVDGVAVALGSNKAQAVLVALALSGGRLVPVERLVELVWDDAPPRTAEQTLQSYVTRLRSTIGPGSIERVGDAYRLGVTPDQVDLVRFERLLDAGEPAMALELWQGAPLAGLALSSTLAAAVVGVAERYLAATEDQLVAAIDRGDAADVVGKLRELTTEYPYRESFWALLMRALYVGGRQGDALRAYSDVRARLIEDLGIEPGPALREVEAQILRHDAALDAAATAAEPASTPGATIDQPGVAEPVATPTVASPLAGPARTKTVLAGRANEMATLVGLAERGRGIGYVLGDAGAGKSTLVESYLDRLVAERWRVARGWCVDDDGVPPLWPWRQVFRDLDLDESMIEASSETNRFELFDRMRRALHLAADDSPIAICVEDLHWTGIDTLNFWTHLVRQTGHDNLVLIGTGRVVPPALSALNITWVTLSPLDISAISAIVEAETEFRCDEAAARRLLERTEGNPFFVTELARAAGRSGKALDINVELPSHVRAAVQQRLDRLPVDTIELLGFASLCLANFSLALLAGAADLDLTVVSAQLEPAFVAGVLVADTSTVDRLRFDHSITREAVEDGLDAREAAERHAALGHALDALLQSADQGASSELSRHFAMGAQAGSQREAVIWGLLAAGQAAATWSHRDAIVHLKRAQRALAYFEEQDLALTCAVLIRLGQSSRIIGEYDAALDALVEAFRVAGRLGDAQLITDAALAMAEGHGTESFTHEWAPGAVALAAMQQALDALPEEDGIARAQLLGQLGADNYQNHDLDARTSMLDEALAMSVRLDDAPSIVRSMQYRRAALGWTWDRSDAYAHDQGLLKLTQEHDLPDEAARARNYVMASLLNLGDLEGLHRLADELRSEARLSGSPLARYFDIQMTMQLGVLRCDWDTVAGAATAGLDETSGIGPSFETAIWNHLALAEIYRGNTEPALNSLRIAVTEGQRSIWFARALFNVLANSGRFDEAQQVFDKFDLLFQGGGQVGGRYALGSVCEGLAAMDRAEGLADLIEYLLPAQEQMAMNMPGVGGLILIGPMRYFIARGLTALDRFDDARRHLVAERPRMQRLEALPHLIQLDVADALLDQRSNGTDKARGKLEQVAGVAANAGLNDMARMVERALAT